MTIEQLAAAAPTWPQIVLAVIGLLTLIYQYVKEGRRRAWEKEDRAEKEAIALAVLKEKEILAGLVRESQLALDQKLDKSTANLTRKVEENTQINKEALVMANNFAQRLADQNDRWDNLLENDRISGVVATQERVKEIHEEVVVHDTAVREGNAEEGNSRGS